MHLPLLRPLLKMHLNPPVLLVQLLMHDLVLLLHRLHRLHAPLLTLILALCISVADVTQNL